MSSAKELFYINSGSKYFMSRNGELTEYVTFNVPDELEREWKTDIKNDIVGKIISEEDITLIHNLSYMDISNEEKREAYKQIALNGNRLKVLEKVERIKDLFDVTSYAEIIEILCTDNN